MYDQIRNIQDEREEISFKIRIRQVVKNNHNHNITMKITWVKC